MSVWRPARCLFTKATSTTLPRPSCPQRCFHASTPVQARKRRPHYPSIKAEDLKLLNEAAEIEYPKFDTSEAALLEKKYTPGQIAAIKAAESAIDARDVLIQGQRRTDPWRLNYEDDLTEVDPVTDNSNKLTIKDIPGDKKTVRFTDDVERDEAIARIATENMAKLYPDGVPEGELNEEEQMKLQSSIEAAMVQASLDPRASFTSKNPAAIEALVDPRHNLVLPDLPRLQSRIAKEQRRLSTDTEDDFAEKRVLQYIGWEKAKLRGLRVKTLVTKFVTNQTRMGKIQSMYFLTIAGNQDGLLGIGEGKSVEPDDGRKKSVLSAIRNMRPVPRYENRTTFGDLEKKVGATKVQLYARPPGKFCLPFLQTHKTDHTIHYTDHYQKVSVSASNT